MEYIYINNNSLSREICKDIVNKFESENNKYEGVTFGGLNKDVKDTLDLNIKKNINLIEEWKDIIDLLDKELSKNIKKYVSKINSEINVDENTLIKTFKYFSSQEISHDTYLIQKYKKNVGKYIYHNDEHMNWDDKKYRILTYLWYLNDIEEGGETEIWNNCKITPKSGKLLIFPSTWCYPHRGRIPISSDKYIITGWIYAKDDK